MIESEDGLRGSIEAIAKLYRLRDREASEPAWDPETRVEMAEDTDVMRRKIEREVAEYLARKYGYGREVAPAPREHVETEKAA